MSKPSFQVGDRFIMKGDLDYPGDEVIIYKISEARRSNTEFKLVITNESYWNFSDRWLNTKQVLKDYRPLTQVERLLYV